MSFAFDDGGRAEAGYKGRTTDCTCRAIAIACELPYQTVYDELNARGKRERRRGKRPHGSARTGVRIATIHKYLAELGWTWHPTMTIGSGTTVHLNPDELPAGRIIVRLSGHLAAVVDGTIRDTHDPSRGGQRCVYGYWTQP